jgi:thiamine-monophosphate kinase
MVRFHNGIIAFASELDMGILGGDLARTPHDTVCSLTILGTVPAAEVVLRRGAREGDVLLATGTFGDSLDTGHHLSFPTRWREGRWLAANGYARAMIDVSDGLVLDAGRLCRASETGLMLDVDAVPLRTPGYDRMQALADGEDYELLAAVQADAVDAVLAEWPFEDVPITPIGWFRCTRDHVVVDCDGTVLQKAGYDHFGA